MNIYYMEQIYLFILYYCLSQAHSQTQTHIHMYTYMYRYILTHAPYAHSHLRVRTSAHTHTTHNTHQLHTPLQHTYPLINVRTHTHAYTNSLHMHLYTRFNIIVELNSSFVSFIKITITIIMIIVQKLILNKFMHDKNYAIEL